MKKVILIVLVFCTIYPVLAQDSSVLFEELTEKYAENDGFSASLLSSDMFELYLRKKNLDETSEVAETLESLDNILVVSQSKFGANVHFFEDKSKPEKTDKTKLDQVYQDILTHYKNNDFSLLKTEKRMGEDIKVYLRKQDGLIQSLALIINSSAVTNLVELNGDIDLANVASLNKVINLKGLEQLYKLDNSGTFPVSGRYYSGYLPLSNERIEELELRAREMAEKHSQLSEEQIKKIEKQAQYHAQKQMEMEEKFRQMAEQYGRHPIFLNAPGDTNTVYYLDGKKVKAKKIKEMDRSKIDKIEFDKAKKEGDKTTIRITTKK